MITRLSSLVGLLVTFGLADAASARPHARTLIAPPAGEAAPAKGCANLAGQWIGTCSTNGQAPEAATTHITQDSCDMVIVDGFISYPNGRSEFHGATAMGAWNDTSDADWNADSSGLHIRGTFTMRHFVTVYFDRTTFSQDLTIRDGRLVTSEKDSTERDINGVVTVENQDIQCVYEK